MRRRRILHPPPFLFGKVRQKLLKRYKEGHD
jgi:hypothetical protein